MKIALLLFGGKLSRWIRDVLSEDGNQSVMRLVLFATWACVLLVWTVLSLAKHEMLEVPQAVIELLLLPTGGKLVQTHLETRSRSDAADPSAVPPRV